MSFWGQIYANLGKKQGKSGTLSGPIANRLGNLYDPLMPRMVREFDLAAAAAANVGQIKGNICSRTDKRVLKILGLDFARHVEKRLAFLPGVLFFSCGSPKSGKGTKVEKDILE